MGATIYYETEVTETVLTEVTKPEGEVLIDDASTQDDDTEEGSE